MAYPYYANSQYYMQNMQDLQNMRDKIDRTNEPKSNATTTACSNYSKFSVST